jgi:hypothetical protein
VLSNGYGASMTEPEHLGELDDGDPPAGPDLFVYRPNPIASALRYAASAPALALGSLIVSTATILTMAAVSDIGDLAIYGSRRPNNISPLRWDTGVRLGVAVLALLLALIAAAMYVSSRPGIEVVLDAEPGLDADLDADDDDPLDDDDGTRSVRLLIGAAVVVGVIAILLNAAAFGAAMSTHVPSNGFFG